MHVNVVNCNVCLMFAFFQDQTIHHTMDSTEELDGSELGTKELYVCTLIIVELLWKICITLVDFVLILIKIHYICIVFMLIIPIIY